MILFILVCFSYNPGRQIKFFISTPLLWVITLLFIIPLITGAWSEDSKEWMGNLRIKLPLLLLPLAFASPFVMSRKQWLTIGVLFILLVTAGSLWTVYHYVLDMETVNEGYLRATTMRTPLENDHVRFSWMVAVAVLISLWLVMDGVSLRQQSAHSKNRLPFTSDFQPAHTSTTSYELINPSTFHPVNLHTPSTAKPNSRFLIPNSLTDKRMSLWIAIVWLSIFLHILAARTGLVCFYLIIFVTMVRCCMVVPNKKKAVTGLALIFLLPLAAWFVLPSFRNKLKYIRFEMDYTKHAHYLPGGNDATRIISFKAGTELIEDNLLAGVGFGDIGRETKKWYSVHYPQMKETEKILPGNEWLIYGTGAGIAGLLLFTLSMVIPFFSTVRQRSRWIIFCSLAAIPFLFDIGLEVQFGVFIYSFILLLCWKWFRVEPVND
jgi:hypothetical protein